MQLTEEEQRVVCEALDVFARIGTGQIEIAVLETTAKHSPARLKGSVGGLSVRDYISDRIREIKMTLFRLNQHAGLSIYNEAVPRDFRVAWDLRMKLIGKPFPRAS